MADDIKTSLADIMKTIKDWKKSSKEKEGGKKKEDKKKDQTVELQKSQLSEFSLMNGSLLKLVDNSQLQIIALENISATIAAIATDILPSNSMDLIDVFREKDNRDKMEAEKLQEKQAAAAAEAGLETPKGEGEKDEDEEKEKGGFFKNIFKFLSVLLIPFIAGFVTGLRKKFDEVTVIITGLIAWITTSPLKAFKLISKMFGFLYEMTLKVFEGIKSIGTKIRDGILRGPKLVKSLFTDLSLMFLKIKDAITESKAFKLVESIFSKIKKFFTMVGEALKPVLKYFDEGRAIFGKLFQFMSTLGGLFKFIAPILGRLALPITILYSLYEGVMGAIEGFKEDGIVGAIKGALVGIIDGLVGWLVGIGQWIVSNLLELFGFDELAKIVEDFNFKDFLNQFIEFFSPIAMLASLFDEKSMIRKQLSKALDVIAKFNIGDMIDELFGSITGWLKNIAEKLSDLIPDIFKSDDGKPKSGGTKDGGKQNKPTPSASKTAEEAENKVANLATALYDAASISGNKQMKEVADDISGEGIALMDSWPDAFEKAGKFGFTAQEIEEMAKTGTKPSKKQAQPKPKKEAPAAPPSQTNAGGPVPQPTAMAPATPAAGSPALEPSPAATVAGSPALEPAAAPQKAAALQIATDAVVDAKSQSTVGQQPVVQNNVSAPTVNNSQNSYQGSLGPAIQGDALAAMA